MNSVNPKIAPGGSAIGQSALSNASGAAGSLAGMGGQLFGQGVPQLQQSGRYFSTLASGNRAAMGQTLAPEVSSLNDVYGGTARTLARFTRGPEKDVQMAEAERGRAGAIGSLFSGGRMGANAQLGSMGSSAVGAGESAVGGAGSLFGGIAKTSQDAAVEQAKLQAQAGQGFGGILFNLLKGFLPYGNKGGG